METSPLLLLLDADVLQAQRAGDEADLAALLHQPPYPPVVIVLLEHTKVTHVTPQTPLVCHPQAWAPDRATRLRLARWKNSTNTFLETRINIEQLVQDNTEHRAAPTMNQNWFWVTPSANQSCDAFLQMRFWWCRCLEGAELFGDVHFWISVSWKAFTFKKKL